jgi:hypothetical protein
MRVSIGPLCVSLALPGGTCLAGSSEQFPDLSLIGPVAPKGRVQDKAFNPNLPVIDSLVRHGQSSLPYLVTKLEDSTEIKGPVFAFWLLRLEHQQYLWDREQRCFRPAPVEK